MQPIDTRELSGGVHVPWVPPEGPPRITPLDPSIYQAMGEDRIFAMVEELYVRLERSTIRSMFADDMHGASQRAAAFFVGLLGGPPLYQQMYGNPAMRARHLPFAIDEPARLVWLACINEVLEHAERSFAFPPEHLPAFRAFLDAFSRWMVNTAPPQALAESESN